MSAMVSVRVARVAAETARVRRYELVPDAGALPPFTAGAHVTVRLPSGAERQYSLANDPAETGRYVLGVLAEPGGRGGSIEMHERVAVGDTLAIRPPANHFPLDPSARSSLLLAGGIGITPILAMAHALARAGAEFRIIHLVRSMEEAAFAADLAAFAGRVTVHCSGGDPALRLDLAALLAAAEPGRHLYCCGPAGMMQAAAAATAHWPAGHVHFEHFANAEAAPRASDDGFTVRLARSGREVAVAPGETILDALLAAGLDVDYSCREGTCGTCITRLLVGAADHRDAVLTEAERAAGDQIVVCCSRALTPTLVLDL